MREKGKCMKNICGKCEAVVKGKRSRCGKCNQRCCKECKPLVSKPCLECKPGQVGSRVVLKESPEAGIGTILAEVEHSLVRVRWSEPDGRENREFRHNPRFLKPYINN